MMRVRVEIVPFGDEAKAYEIGRLDIFNKGYVDDSIGNYAYGVIHIDSEKKQAGMFDEDIIHTRSHGAWALLRRILEKMV